MSRGELLRSLGSQPVADVDGDSRTIALENALRWKKRKRKDPHLLPLVSSASGYAAIFYIGGVIGFAVDTPQLLYLLLHRVSFVICAHRCILLYCHTHTHIYIYIYVLCL